MSVSCSNKDLSRYDIYHDKSCLNENKIEHLDIYHNSNCKVSNDSDENNNLKSDKIEVNTNANNKLIQEYNINNLNYKYSNKFDYNQINNIDKDFYIEKIINQNKRLNWLEEQLEIFNQRTKKAEDKIDNNMHNNNIFNKLNNILEENSQLSDQLEFALDFLDQCLSYLNHFYNIINKDNIIIPIHTFTKNQFKDFLKDLELNLFDLLDKENKLNDILNPNPILDPNNKNYNGSKNLELTLTMKDNLINNLIDENNKLSKELKNLKDVNNKNNNKKNMFNTDNLRIINATTIKLESQCPNLTIENIDNLSIEEHTKDIAGQLGTELSSHRYRGKFKKIDPNNLYNKYYDGKIEKFAKNHWASDTYVSKLKKDGKRTKVIEAKVEEKIELAPKQIIPPIKKTYAHLLNKNLKEIAEKFVDSKEKHFKVKKFDFENN